MAETFFTSHLFSLSLFSAARAFLSAIYKDLHFQRINEIHFRLGLIYKELNATSFSLRHFKLALIDSLSTLSSVTKSDSKHKPAFLLLFDLFYCAHASTPLPLLLYF